MARQQPPKKARSKPPSPEAVAADASAAVQQAASVLESELASGLAGIRKLETRFTSERRVDQKEFDEVLDRLRVSTHEFIDAAAARMADLRSPEAQDLTQRLTTDGHDLSDTLINLLGSAPDLVNRLAARADVTTPAPAKESKPSAKGATARARSRSKTSE